MKHPRNATPTDIDKIVGEIFQNIRLERGQGTEDKIFIDTTSGTYVGYVRGGCCSKSWVEHIDLDQPFSGAKITWIGATGSMNMHPWDDDTKTEQYFWTLKTEYGRINWELRNESNGYYDGYIDWYDWTPDVKVFG